jgi:DNA/RNA endonuclease G (NUC1)
MKKFYIKKIQVPLKDEYFKYFAIPVKKTGLAYENYANVEKIMLDGEFSNLGRIDNIFVEVKVLEDKKQITFPLLKKVRLL